MSRFSTKGKTPAELKSMRKELGASLKALEGSLKLNGANVKAAHKVNDAAVATAGKTLVAAEKAHDAAVKASNKTLTAALKAAEKEAATLNTQIAAHKAKIEQVENAIAAPQPDTKKVKSAGAEAPV